MNIVDEKIINDLAIMRNLSPKTKQGYFNALNCYIGFNNLGFKSLLEEAENEEIKGIRWKDRKLKQRLIHFRVFLQEKYLVSTAKVYFQRILTLYTHFEIEIHKLPPVSTKSSRMSKPITFEDLPTKEIIKQAVEIANPIMRAIILFMSSSGCARNETLKLTIHDFINATYEYHKEKDVKKALIKLSKLDNIVPIFRINRQKTNKFYFTFCSPEASNEIIYFLLDNDSFNKDSPLFDINLYYFNKYFRDINDSLNLGKIGPYNRFRSHMLRKFHASSLYNSKNGLSLEEIDSLQGRSKDKTHSSYFMENPNILKEKYINSLDAIKINI